MKNVDDFSEFEEYKPPEDQQITDDFDEFELVESPSLTSETIQGFGGGVNVGLAETTGAPVDITNAILSLVGLGAKEPIMGSDWIKRQASKISTIPGMGDPFYEGPDTQTGRIISRVGKEIGASAPAAAGMLRLARGIPAAIDVGEGFIKRQILNPIARAPGAATAGEAIASAGAGLGAGIAQEQAPGSVGAEMTGQIVGGITPSIIALTPSAWIARLSRRIVSRFSAESQTKAAADTVKKLIGSNLDAENLVNLKGAQNLQEKIPGFKPSVAEATKEPTLILQQEFLEDQATGDFLDQVINRRIENEKAITIYSKKPFENADTDIEYIIDASNNRYQTISGEVEKATTRMVQKKEDLAKNLVTIDKLQTGKAMRQGIEQARMERSAEMSLLAQDFNIADADFTTEFKIFQQELAESYQPKSRFQTTEEYPPILNAIIKDEGDITTFQDIKIIRERLSDAVIDETSSANPSRKRLRTLRMLKKDVDDFFDDVGGTLGDDWRTFRKTYFEQYITPFESGAVFKARNRDGTGFYKNTDENVASSFFKDQSGAKQYNEVFGEDPIMMGHMENSILDDLRSNTVVDGIIDDRKLSLWMKKNNASLSELPSIQEKIANTESTQRTLTNRQIQLGNRSRKVQNNTLVKHLEKFTKGEQSADQVITAALANPQKMRNLTNSIRNDKDAFESLQRNIWDKASKGSPASMLKFLDTNHDSLVQLYGPDHFTHLADVIYARGMTETIKHPKGIAHIPAPLDKIEKMTGMAFPQLGTRLYAFKTGRLSKSYLVFDLAKSVLYGRSSVSLDKMMRQALYDPEVARLLANSFESLTFTPKKAKQLGARMFNLGLPFLEDADKEAGIVQAEAGI